jgi:hypothetical protein
MALEVTPLVSLEATSFAMLTDGSTPTITETMSAPVCCLAGRANR